MIFNINTLTVRNLNVYDHLISNGPYIQCVRWKRKPIWLPTAKSKMYKIPQRPVIPIEDQCELKRLFNNYRTIMKSLMYMKFPLLFIIIQQIYYNIVYYKLLYKMIHCNFVLGLFLLKKKKKEKRTWILIL